MTFQLLSDAYCDNYSHINKKQTLQLIFTGPRIIFKPYKLSALCGLFYVSLVK